MFGGDDGSCAAENPWWVRRFHRGGIGAAGWRRREDGREFCAIHWDAQMSHLHGEVVGTRVTPATHDRTEVNRQNGGTSWGGGGATQVGLF